MDSSPVSRTSRPTVLLTEGASLSARHTLYGLGPHYTIDVIDPDPLCQCRFSRYSRRWTRSPSFAADPEEFLRFLAEQVRDHQYDVVLPTHEQVYLLSRFREALGAHTGVALPPFESLERLQNKAEFCRLLVELDLPQPEVAFVRHRADFDRPWQYPFYLKLSHSTAGSGVFAIKNKDELAARLDNLESRGLLTGHSDVLVQQPARGVQATVQVVFDEGRLVAIHMFEARRLGVGGMSSARVSAYHPAVVEHMEKLGRHVAWHGATFIDYYYDHETGRPEYIEANPRIGETVNALLSGVNIPDVTVRLSRCEELERQPLGKTGVLSQSFYMILMTLAYDGGSRWQLLKELWKYFRGQGLYADSQDELTRPRDDWLSVLPRFWITLQLLLWPKLARRIVDKTVENYALPEAATEKIKSLPADAMELAFSAADLRGSTEQTV